MTIFKYALLRNFRNIYTLLLLTLIPIGLIVIRPLWREEDAMGYTLYAVVIFFAAFLMVRTVMTDRVSGILKRVFAAPVNTFRYLSQNLLAYQVVLTVQIFLVIVVGSILYQWGIVLAMQMFLCYTVFAGSAIGFSLAWNAFFKNKEISDAMFGIIISFMFLLGGIFIPIEMLPDTLKKIGMVFPTYWLSNALLALSYNDITQYSISIGAMFMFTVACVIFGSQKRIE
ncbi:ABC-2 family transporter [Natranaerovirga hydrolytica]|uniref:ABC-2 family transporter n=1 Tax=Natranaerovirga hydrolytica TaxID=680378 RepID=A0A4R1MJ29_9FIRM|nr:ABC transporter permease [Natranaerovirga hydrolytica]TCK92758.1 ABC-2 family transporter [Natranaerovirga hydrolytica]